MRYNSRRNKSRRNRNSKRTRITESDIRGMIREEISNLQEASRDDRRYVDSSNPRAVFQAWAGKSRRNATVDMGGWTDERDVNGFIQALEDEMEYANSFYEYVEIIDSDTGDVIETL